ncbi:MAG: hypothetical protein LBI03_00950, partial [Clostridiales bacterium]|nr:hypothetical protein [Clostridiales bacterium]
MTFNFITGEVNSGYYRFGSDFGFEEQKEFPEQISYTAQRYECYENECYEKYNKEYKLPSGHSESYIDCTSQYFKDISGIEVLADSEVGELWKRYKYGDKNAFDKLV